jgi:hypothetical protein
MKYRVTQYRKLEAFVEADSPEELEEIVAELADDDFEVVDWQESVEETT